MKNDFGMNHAPVQPFFGNWLYWQAVALAHNVGLWLRTLALPTTYRRARGKRLRLGFLNVAARLVRHGRRLHLRFGAAYRHLQAFAHGPGPTPSLARLRLTARPQHHSCRHGDAACPAKTRIVHQQQPKPAGHRHNNPVKVIEDHPACFIAPHHPGLRLRLADQRRKSPPARPG